jgi:hypothetical protein
MVQLRSKIKPKTISEVRAHIHSKSEHDEHLGTAEPDPKAAFIRLINIGTWY